MTKWKLQEIVVGSCVWTDVLLHGFSIEPNSKKEGIKIRDAFIKFCDLAYNGSYSSRVRLLKVTEEVEK